MLRKAAGIIAGLFILVAVVTLFVLWLAGSGEKKAAADAGLLRAGMTIDEAIGSFPKQFSFASASEKTRDQPCKNEKGEISPPEKLTYWPDQDDADAEGNRLSWIASQLPFNPAALDAFSDHLAARGEWKKMLQVWDSVLEDQSGNGHAYARRSVAYTRLSDLTSAYRDSKQSCKLNDAEGCALVKEFSTKLRRAIDSEDARIFNSAERCLPPAPIIRIMHVPENGRFALSVASPPELAELSRSLSAHEFAALLQSSFAGREWVFTFTYINATPRHTYFHVVMGKDGKIAEVTNTGFMD
jgi:hypothetical protein